MPGTFDRTRGRAITREVSPLYSEAISEFFSLKGPDYTAALGAQEAYFAALRAHGTDVVTLPALEGFPDCSFTEDTAVIIDEKAIVTNLGHPSRQGEQESIADFLRDDFEIIRMPEGSTLDGGDVIFYDDCFLIGISTRTNKEGADFLAAHAERSGFGARFFEVPHTTLHLTTVCSSPKQGLVVAAKGQLPPGALSFADEVIWIPEEEGYAANTIAYGDRIILADGYPKTRRLLMEAGFSITTVEMSEFREVDASLTCLSVFIG
tara:strand:- start:607 stop:1398 length:792 start_codon:yes stop_codon:yes gene_type:complete